MTREEYTAKWHQGTNTTNPLALCIEALNDIPRTRFRQPIGGCKDTYELVAQLEREQRMGPTFDLRPYLKPTGPAYK